MNISALYISTPMEFNRALILFVKVTKHDLIV